MVQKVDLESEQFKSYLAEAAEQKLKYDSFLKTESKNRDIAVSTSTVAYLLSWLDWKRKVTKDLSVLEMGAGFSTLVLLDYNRKNGNCFKLLSVDHNPDWILLVRRAIRDILKIRLVDDDYFQLMLIPRYTEFLKQHDLIIVDHGPTEKQRAIDLEWVMKLLKPGGLLFFDDWKNKPPNIELFTNALEKLGSWNIEVFAPSAYGLPGKSVGLVWRKTK